MNNYIMKFDGTKYEFLSNFYPVKNGISLGDDLGKYPTTEHAFQASKTFNNDDRVRIKNAGTPGAAKRLGRRVNLRDDWEDVKDSIMLDILEQKFNGVDDKLTYLLLLTGDSILVEGTTGWHDNYWGVCSCDKCMGIGQNKLGQMLMMVRDKLNVIYKTPDMAVKSIIDDKLSYEIPDIV